MIFVIIFCVINTAGLVLLYDSYKEEQHYQHQQLKRIEYKIDKQKDTGVKT